MTDAKFKDGDVFEWRWADDDRDRKSGGYHCYSRIAVAKNGSLFDTYWDDESKRLNLDEVIIHFRCNQNEWEQISAYEARYYSPDDVQDMGHPNNSRAPIYRRPGAKRNAEIMRGIIKSELERAEAMTRLTEAAVARLQDALTEVNEGRLDGVFIG